MECLMSLVEAIPLDIILSPCDQISDLLFIKDLFVGGHPKYAVLLLIFFLAQYVWCFVNWYGDKTNHWWTIIFPLLNLYTTYGKVFLFSTGDILI